MTVSAFLNPKNGSIVISGKNDSKDARSIEGILANLSKILKLKYYYTDSLHNFSRGTDVTVTNQGFSILIPPSCVFTLVSM